MSVPSNNAYEKTSGPCSCRSGQWRGTRLQWPVILIGIAVLFIAAAPVSAGEQYMAGSPVLSASLSGINEFTPGKDVQLAVVIENTGTNQFKFVKSGIVNTDDLPNTAKFLTVTLEHGDSPFIIKSDPQMLGDLKASSTAKGIFTIRIPSDTPSGSYSLPVKLNYTYLYTSEQYGTDTVQYYYKTKDEIFGIPVKVKPDVRVSVLSTEVSHLNAGTEGYITLKVNNAGHENATKAIVMIARNDGSPVTPTQGSAYIGDFPSGGTATCIFRASVDDNAGAQTYPLDVYVKYENREGDTVSSDIETIGIPVGGKIDFTIVSDPQTIVPGQKKVIVVQIRNTGGATAYQAQARVSMVDPFTSNDDSAFLGDIAPGETKTASFLISADKTATVKQYGIDTEVRYRDALDNSVISDPMKLNVNVTADTGLPAQLAGNPVALVVIAAVILGAGYLLYRRQMAR
jgi:uncharacterized membrane protein